MPDTKGSRRDGWERRLPPSHTSLQIAEQDWVIGLQHFARCQLVGAPVCTARIDPAMHTAIALFGRRVAWGQVYGELQVEARLAQ